MADLVSNGDEAPRAYIMPQNKDKATPELAEAIKAWLAERVSRHKRLEGGVHFIDAVPKNPVSGTCATSAKRSLTSAVWKDPEEAAERAGGAGRHEGQAVGAQMIKDMSRLDSNIDMLCPAKYSNSMSLQTAVPCYMQQFGVVADSRALLNAAI